MGPRTTDRRTAVLAAVAGALLLNATLPLEIDLMFRAIGRPLSLSWLGLYLMALLVAGSISALIAALRGPRAVGVAQAPPITASPSLLAQRTGLADIAGVLMMAEEDHYLRLVLANGRRPLALFRLSDALPELAAHDGLEVHRSGRVARRHPPCGCRAARWAALVAGAGRRDGTGGERDVPLRCARGRLASDEAVWVHVHHHAHVGWQSRAAYPLA